MCYIILYTQSVKLVINVNIEQKHNVKEVAGIKIIHIYVEKYKT